MTSPPPPLAVGESVEVEIGSIAHGGHCVARYDGRVLFVRHTAPGERVVAQVTGSGPGGRFLYADAVAIRDASPDRVPAPCPYAGPGGCGGCDFQHLTLPAQRALKAAVVREQFARLAGLDVAVEVEPLTEPEPGLRWRTRVEFAVDERGRAGLRAHRSHAVVPVADCLIASHAVMATGVLQHDWSGFTGVDVVAPSVGEPVVSPVPGAAAQLVRESVATPGFGHVFEVAARGFWQGHPHAAATFLARVLADLEPRPGERALDLYAGAGLFAAALAAAVGPGGEVLAVESDETACRNAAVNLGSWPHARVLRGRVDDLFGVPRPARRGPDRATRRRPTRRSPALPQRADLVVLDPPRAGAGEAVARAIAGLSPRAIAYVACDPAALARDTAELARAGYLLTGLTAYDAFPMTHHVECVATFREDRQHGPE